jgi:hypothetical protein
MTVNMIVVPMFWTVLWGLITPWCAELGSEEGNCLFYQGFGHAWPMISVFLLILTSDVTLVETDWRSCFVRCLIYIPCNISGVIVTGGGLYGFEAWGSNFWTILLVFFVLTFIMCGIYKLQCKFFNWIRASIFKS